MKYSVQTGSGAIIFIPSFVDTGSAIQKLATGGTKTYGQHGDHISLLLYFQNKQSRQKLPNLILPSYTKWTKTSATGHFFRNVIILYIKLKDGDTILIPSHPLVGTFSNYPVCKSSSRQ
jgi:hypothetical protein